MDSLWALSEVYNLGILSPERKEPDPVFTRGMRRFVDLFAEYNVPATFFVCGRDCQAQKHANLIREAFLNDHEIASHSQNHTIGFHQQGREAIIKELEKSAEAIKQTCGKTPIGFRMPGFGISEELAACLIENDFQYDSSLLSSSINPIIHLVSRLIGASGNKKTAREYTLYKNNPEPYRMHTSRNATPRYLIELPVSVTPRLRLPIHASIAMAAGWRYTKSGIKRLLKNRQVIVYLFHAVDLVGASEINGLPSGLIGKRIFPKSKEKKEAFVRNILDLLTQKGKVMKTTDWLNQNKL